MMTQLKEDILDFLIHPDLNKFRNVGHRSLFSIFRLYDMYYTRLLVISD